MFDDLSVNRFLFRQNSNYQNLSNSPFQGLSPGIPSGNSYIPDDDGSNSQAPGVQTGSVITNSLVRTSQGGQQRTIIGIPFGNGRVELNQGFKDSNQGEFPFDSLTAFDYTGAAQVIISEFGILMTEGANSFRPVITYLIDGVSYTQPAFLGVGRVNADGTTTSNFPSSWSVVHTTTGKYTFIPNDPFPDAEYGVNLTPVGPAPGMVVLADTNVAFFDVWTYDASGTLADSEFSFQVFTNFA